jgi:L,D-peptidoglycan transpeptidase YkuD (ErfK/YbiS/YcfS/YnhG family)
MDARVTRDHTSRRAWPFLLAAVALATVVLLAGSHTTAARAGCTPNPAGALGSAAGASQLITVVAPATGSTFATVRLWRRSGGCWVVAAGPWTARVGYNGLSGHHREGDGTTPTGVYAIGPVMYGTEPDPGVRYVYHRLVCGDWWDEDPGSTAYNTFQHVPCGTAPPFHGDSESLWLDTDVYRHFALIDFNTNPVVAGRGSAMFLHVSRGRATTGCVALPYGELVRTLRWLRPGDRPLIAIGTAAAVRGS